MGISMNGPSGIDTGHIIDSLVELEYNTRIKPVEVRVDAFQLKIDAYSKFKSILSELGSKAFALNTATSFDVFTESTSDEELVSVEGGTNAQEGTYDVGVYHLARREKMISGEGLIADQEAALSSLGIGVGTIRINGTDIEIDADDTVQDMRRKINSATDADGKDIGVTASVLKLSDANYRLVLTADDTGSAGATYEDVSGSTLQDLGIIQTAAGEKGTTAQQLLSADDINAAFGGLAAGDVVQYTGTDHSGNEVSGTFVVGASSTVDDLLGHIEETYHGTVTASLGAGGELVLTDNIAGNSQLLMSSLELGGTAYDMGIGTAGDEGAGVLNAGSDAFFSVDGLLMTSTENEASGFISGVTLTLNGVSAEKRATVEVARDYDALAGKVEELINAFNGLVRFRREQTTFGDPEDDSSTKGPLAGDMTVGSVVGRMRSVFQRNFELFGTDYTNLAELGVKTDYTTGELELDKDSFKEALREDFDEVKRMFIKSGLSDTPGISFGRSTEDTESAIYELEEVDADTVRIRIQGEATWYESDTRVGEIITFSEGPAKGLSLTLPEGTIGGGATATFTYSKGLSGYLSDEVDRLTDGSEGLVAMRQETWTRRIEQSKDRIEQLEGRILSYRERLVRDFSHMEQMLARMESQTANMFSALGM